MDSLIPTSVKVEKEIKITDNSKFFLQLGDSNFRVPCRNTILKYPGLNSRCIWDDGNIICVIPTSSTEMISLVALIFTSLVTDIDTLNFLDYLDPELPTTFLNMLSKQPVELSIPYLNYNQLTDSGIKDPYLNVSAFPEFRRDLLSFFKAPKELPPGSNLKYINHIVFSHEYIPYALKLVNNDVSPLTLTYMLEYIHAYEIYFAITDNLPVLTYTNEIDILRGLDANKYKQCWNHLIEDDSVSRTSHKKVDRSYVDMVSIIKGRLKAHPRYKQIKAILESGLGVVTGGFIAACMYNTEHTDIDICLHQHVYISEIKSMFENVVEINDSRFTVDDLDIFVSSTSIYHNISSFHMSVVRAYYDGIKLYMFPSCLISALNNVIHINHLRLLHNTISKYWDRGFTFETKYMLGAEGGEVTKIDKSVSYKSQPTHSYYNMYCLENI